MRADPSGDSKVSRCQLCGSWTWRGECSTCATDEHLESYG